MEPLQHRLGARIGLLPLDTPVLELLERYGDAGHGAAHEGARPHHPEIAVEVADFGLARGRPMIVAVEHLCRSSPAARDRPNIMPPARARNPCTGRCNAEIVSSGGQPLMV